MVRLKLGLQNVGLANLDWKYSKIAADRLTEAFENDPCLKYLIGSDEYDYSKAINIHTYTLRLGKRYGSILTTSISVEGISIWIPPSRVDTTPWMFIRSGGLNLEKTVRKGTLDRLKEYGAYSSKMHHKHVKSPHWYLLSIAVGKQYQGKGFAGRLLKPVLQHFDKTGFPCYLETHNSANIEFYKKYGFQVVEVGKLPSTNKDHFSMLRLPAV
jgi:ribosomal protein S18 acetylase RimI-like enzyme